MPGEGGHRDSGFVSVRELFPVIMYFFFKVLLCVFAFHYLQLLEHHRFLSCLVIRMTLFFLFVYCGHDVHEVKLHHSLVCLVILMVLVIGFALCPFLFLFLVLDLGGVDGQWNAGFR